MNFRLTARDRDSTGGGLSVDDTVITVAGAHRSPSPVRPGRRR